MEEKCYIIYCHKNLLNNKRYIGQTKQTPAKRWGKNGSEYLRKGNEHFKNAILKYGWDNFEHLILYTNLDREEANLKEIELIQLYQTNNPDYGYNLTNGGNTNTLTNAQKELRRQKNYEMWENGTFKQSINKAVYCVELDLAFESSLEAQRKTGIDSSSIIKVCKQKLKYAGFMPNGQPIHWIYLQDKNSNIIQQLKNKPEVIKGTSIPMLCIETGEIFNSSTEADSFYHLGKGSSRKCATGKLKSAGIHPTTKECLHWKACPELIKNKNKLTQQKVDELLQ